MMIRLHIALLLVITAFVALALIFIIRRLSRPQRQNGFVVSDAERGPHNLPNGSARLNQVSPHHPHLDRDASKKTSYHLFRRGASTKQAFSWVDHPSFVTDAVENGWSRFAFAIFMSSPSVKSTRSLLGSCAAADHGSENGVEIGWEVCEGSAEFMQKVRLSPDVKKAVAASPSPSMAAAAAVIRTALPLPGPNLGESSFPQEAYFEITIVSLSENAGSREVGSVEKKESWEGEKLKLINEDFNAKNSPHELVSEEASSHSQRRSKVEEREDEVVLVSVGLTGGNPLPFRIPGTFPASVGFNSTGSVYLDGTKLVSNSDPGGWGATDKVIGCGYSPGQKRVFFTVDSQMVHEIHCNSPHFCSPLYPTLAANADVVVLVNLGQSPFRFAPANLQRTPNPCFTGPPAASPGNAGIGYYEDSRELFSMGRFDSPTRGHNSMLDSIKSMEEFEQEFEGDLFEIVLDTTGRSPFSSLNRH